MIVTTCLIAILTQKTGFFDNPKEAPFNCIITQNRPKLPEIAKNETKYTKILKTLFRLLG